MDGTGTRDGRSGRAGGRERRWRPVVPLVAVLTLATLAGACTVDDDLAGRAPGDVLGSGEVALVRAGSCERLGELTAPTPTTTADGGPDRLLPDLAEDATVAGPSTAEGSARAAAPSPSPSPSPAAPGTSPAPGGDPPADPGETGTVVAGTNVQEAAVDEADLVKTDGRRLVAVVDTVLRVVLLDGSPAVDGVLDLGPVGAVELLLRGEEALVVGTDGTGTTLTRVALQDPSAPRVLETVRVDGAPQATRVVGGRARVVLQSWTPGPAALPTVDGERLGRCEDVLVPATTTAATPDPAVGGPAPDVTSVGSAVTTVLSVGDTLADLAPLTVAAAGDVVYASPAALYLAGSSWSTGGPVTTVHRIDLTTPGPARATGSGTVPGTLLDRYSLSEHRGDLRVVTTLPGATPTTGPDEGRAAVLPVSQGRLSVLRPGADGALGEVGHVDGLGPDEAVQAVRFLGDRAYVVTFRQVDPLYALDLSDPTAPRVLGELKIPGFSEYLHPVGDGLLLGVGSDADPAIGVVTGARIALFDVRDPAAPRELDVRVVPDARADVADEPRAFSWDPVRGQAVVTMQRWGAVGPACGPAVDCPADPTGPVGTVPTVDPGIAGSGTAIAEPGPAADEIAPVGGDAWASVLGVAGDRLVDRGELRHVADPGVGPMPIRRAVVVDDDLWTVSSVGLGRTDARSPTTVDLLRWP